MKIYGFETRRVSLESCIIPILITTSLLHHCILTKDNFGTKTFKQDSEISINGNKLVIQSTPLNRVTSVRGHFAPIKRRTLLTENILY